MAKGTDHCDGSQLREGTQRKQSLLFLLEGVYSS